MLTSSPLRTQRGTEPLHEACLAGMQGEMGGPLERARLRTVLGVRRSTLLLTLYALFYAVFLVSGALVFMAVESPEERRQDAQMLLTRRNFLRDHPCVSGKGLLLGNIATVLSALSQCRGIWANLNLFGIDSGEITHCSVRGVQGDQNGCRQDDVSRKNALYAMNWKTYTTIIGKSQHPLTLFVTHKLTLEFLRSDEPFGRYSGLKQTKPLEIRGSQRRPYRCLMTSERYADKLVLDSRRQFMLGSHWHDESDMTLNCRCNDLVFSPLARHDDANHADLLSSSRRPQLASTAALGGLHVVSGRYDGGEDGMAGGGGGRSVLLGIGPIAPLPPPERCASISLVKPAPIPLAKAKAVLLLSTSNSFNLHEFLMMKQYSSAYSSPPPHCKQNAGKLNEERRHVDFFRFHQRTYLHPCSDARLPADTALASALGVLDLVHNTVFSHLTHHSKQIIHKRLVLEFNNSHWPNEIEDCGGGVVRLLTSHLGEPVSIPGGVTPGFSHVGIVPDDAAGRRVFSRISRSHTHITLIGSQDLNVKSHPNISIPLSIKMERSFVPTHNNNNNNEMKLFYTKGSLSTTPSPPPPSSTPFNYWSQWTHTEKHVSSLMALFTAKINPPGEVKSAKAGEERSGRVLANRTDSALASC
ncbi:hypothetical protein PR048_014366 [Dryococelus australis]|uniref:Uncharacterized protein n=1 Tax=Dryococelus australis TaxID=614101 RepID=A0ABQ9HDY8_9NEOP|nr:hypothetical protein PR048_014366 [Dryococelus australis]